MSDIKRTVKLIPRKPLYGIKRTPITSCVEKIELTTEEIRLCLVTKCLVEEYLPDGSLLKLDLSNYHQKSVIEAPVDIVEPVGESEPVINTEPSRLEEDFTRSDEAFPSGWGEENPVNDLLNKSIYHPSIPDEATIEGDMTDPVMGGLVLDTESEKEDTVKPETVVNPVTKGSTSNIKPPKNQSNKNNSNKK